VLQGPRCKKHSSSIRRTKPKTSPALPCTCCAGVSTRMNSRIGLPKKYPSHPLGKKRHVYPTYRNSIFSGRRFQWAAPAQPDIAIRLQAERQIGEDRINASYRSADHHDRLKKSKAFCFTQLALLAVCRSPRRLRIFAAAYNRPDPSSHQWRAPPPYSPAFCFRRPLMTLAGPGHAA